MSRGMPRFFDLPGDDASAGRWAGKPRSAPPDADRTTRHDRPVPFEPAPDAIDAGWMPDRPQAARRGRGASVLALTGIADLLAGWLLVSLVGSIIEAYHASPSFGGLALCIYAIGLSLITLAGVSEWQAWRSLRRVD